MIKSKLEKTKKIGYGTYKLRDALELVDLLKAAKDAGYDYVDCAWRYGNEASIGMAVKDLEVLNYAFDLPIHSKIWHSQYKGGINKSLKTCLTKLGIKQIDSYMLHRPDYSVRLTISAWKQLVDCKRMNLVKTIGVSNFDKGLINALEEATSYRPEFNQIELSVNNMRWDRIKYCQEKNIRIQAYSPLGHLEKNLIDERIVKIAEKHKATVPQILLAYLINLDIEPIVKSSNVNHIVENIKAKQIILSEKEMEVLKSINSYENLHSEGVEIDLEEMRRVS